MHIHIPCPLKSVSKTPSLEQKYSHNHSLNSIKNKIRAVLTPSQFHHLSHNSKSFPNSSSTSTPNIMDSQKKTYRMELESWLMTRWTFSFPLGTGPTWTDFLLSSYSTKPPLMALGSIIKCMDGTPFALNIFKSIFKLSTGTTLDNKNPYLAKD